MRHNSSLAFTVMALAACLCPPLGFASILYTAEEFGVLGSSTVTNTGPSTVMGDLGVSPGSAIVGFDIPGGPGTVFGTIHAADSVAAQAQTDARTAYTGLSNMASTQDMTGQDLGNRTLMPGVYHFDSSAQLTGALTLDGQSSNDAFWVFQVGSSLTTASASSVSLINPGAGIGVYWQVGSSATLGTGTSFLGNILADQSITLNTGANIDCGSALALVGAVTMDTNTICANCGVGEVPLSVSGGLEFGAGGEVVPISGGSGGGGTGPAAPEPLSMSLFLAGGAALAARKLRKKKEVQ